MSEPLLTLREVDAGYGTMRVVRGISLHVDAGEVVALLGPNGAGKTTTLLTATGALRPLAGSVEALGAPIRPGRTHLVARRGVAFVPEDRALFYGLTVQENLRLGSRKRPTDLKAVLDYIPELGDLLKRKAGLLSGGEQQMLAIGRALMSRPRLLIVDELSLGLAPTLAQRVSRVVSEVATESGCSVLLVEQHAYLALAAADRAYVLSHGDLVLEARSEDLAADAQLLESSYLGEVALGGVEESA